MNSFSNPQQAVDPAVNQVAHVGGQLQAQIAAGTDATAAWNSSLVEIGRAR